MGRRRARACGVLAALALAACGSSSPPPHGSPPVDPGGDNAVARENALPGDAGWQLRHRAPAGALEGYAGAASVNHGEAIDVHLSVDAPHDVRWTLYRMGWYGGAEGRRVAAGGPVAVRPQPAPSPSATTGLVECRWPTSFTIETGRDWATGMYLVKLERDDGYQSYVPFVVRADERRGAAAAQLSFNTYQAYNRWGGKSLYVGGADEVSFDRPYAEGSGAGQYFRFEHDFVRWAESRGFDLVYLTNLDLDRDASFVRAQRLFVSVGHDEYWTRPAREALETALASGTSAAFFSGNSMFWQVRLEPSRGGGAPRRTLVGYKEDAAAKDPLRGTPLETTQWRDPRLSDPENAVLGVMYSAWQLVDAPWIVANATAWPYEGTGLADGDALPLVVGYETDRLFDNGRTPPGTTLLARSPVLTVDGAPDVHEAAVRDLPSGGFVFAAGTIQWPWGLAHDGVVDARVRRITENVFGRAGIVPALPPRLSNDRPRAIVDAQGASAQVSTLAGRAFEEGLRDGAASDARFRRPAAIARDAAGNLWVADTGNHAVRLLRAADGRVITVAGDGTPGAGEGVGARLRLPQGIAVAPDGTVIVADTGNDRLVRLRPAGAAWAVETWAGGRGSGYADGPATDARFAQPAGIAFAGADLYVADRWNGRIRRVDAARQVTTVAGRGDRGFADGVGGAAVFDFPSDVAAAGSALLVVDANNRAVRRVDLASQRVTTLVGGRPGGFADGPAAEALLMPAAGLALDGEGILLADSGNARVRRIAAGEVTTFAGSGDAGARDGGGAEARFAGPMDLVPVAPGGWAVVDGSASTLRLVTLAAP